MSSSKYAPIPNAKSTLLSSTRKIPSYGATPAATSATRNAAPAATGNASAQEVGTVATAATRNAAAVTLAAPAATGNASAQGVGTVATAAATAALTTTNTNSKKNPIEATLETTIGEFIKNPKKEIIVVVEKTDNGSFIAKSVNINPSKKTEGGRRSKKTRKQKKNRKQKKTKGRRRH